jgi:nicotinamidase-related amidase
METMPGGVQRGFMKDEIASSISELRPWMGLGAELPDDQGRCLFADTWNADIYPPLKEHVQASDIHCAKNRMSGLWTPEQPLWKVLEKEKISTVLYAGVNTDQCVLGTFIDGYNAGWNSILVDDCCGTPTVGAKEVTLLNIAVSFTLHFESGNIRILVLTCISELLWFCHQ